MEIEIVLRDYSRTTVEAEILSPGFAIHKTVIGCGYTLTHIKSGKAVVVRYRYRDCLSIHHKVLELWNGLSYLDEQLSLKIIETIRRFEYEAAGKESTVHRQHPPLDSGCCGDAGGRSQLG